MEAWLATQIMSPFHVATLKELPEKALLYHSHLYSLVEFPAVLLELSSGKILSEFHHYVTPFENPTLSPFCNELTGITQVRSGRLLLLLLLLLLLFLAFISIVLLFILSISLFIIVVLYYIRFIGIVILIPNHHQCFYLGSGEQWHPSSNLPLCL